jgi:hypothetical protein
MPTLDERIAQALKEAAESGELERARGYGKPLPEIPGWDDTPEALRMPFKILKDAGIAPAEVELFHERARLREAIDASGDPPERERLQRELGILEAKIALRLEALRLHGSL